VKHVETNFRECRIHRANNQQEGLLSM
jgi:hypothetical protein